MLTQVGFFDIVALPLFQSLAQVFSGTVPLLDAVRDNYVMWKEETAVNHSSGSSNGSMRRTSLEQRNSHGPADGDQ
jgi:hypothetical protein